MDEVNEDTLAMQFYGVSTTPIIKKLDHRITNVHQVWLADDATGAGSLNQLKEWWDLVSTEGSRYGYHVKPSKSWLILKDPQKLQAAETMFKNSQIKITTSGKRHLGASLGTDGFKTTYMTEKVKVWCEKLNRLTEIAKLQPLHNTVTHTSYAPSMV